MRRIRINIHEPKIVIVIEETNEKNVSITDNIFAKREVKRWKSDVDVNNDSWGVIHWIGFSSKGKPIWMIHNAYQRNTFTVFWTGNWPNSCSRWLLDEDNIKIVVDFENSVDDEVVLLNVLQKNLQILQNHIVLPFTAEWIKFFQLSWILAYSLVCHSLLNLCFQNAHLVELAWWLSLQFKHLNVWGQGLLFFVSNLGGLVFFLALQHYMK